MSKTISIDEQQIAAYLEEHPEFFENRDQLVAKLSLPHGESGAISLVEKQVSVLRARSQTLQHELTTYLQVARSNDDIYKKCQHLILGLIEATSVDEFFANLEKSLKRDFKSQVYSLIIFGDKPRQENHFVSIVTEANAREAVGKLMKGKKPTLGPLVNTQQDFLFNEQGSRVKSAVVVPVSTGRDPMALLVIGSADPNYYQAGMGTTFLTFIAEVLARLIPRYIQ